MRIVVLADDVAGSRGLLGEHGLSLWIETRDRRVLFDTGQGLALAHNAEALGIPLGRADAVVLSHGHYDHTGGLAVVLAGRNALEVFAQPEALSLRYAGGSGSEAREIGMPAAARAALTRRGALRSSKGRSRCAAACRSPARSPGSPTSKVKPGPSSSTRREASRIR